MKKLKFIMCAILLMIALGLSLGTWGSGGPLLVKIAGAAEECIKCTELSCAGGDLKYASFLCRGTFVLCYTRSPQPQSPPPPPPAPVVN